MSVDDLKELFFKASTQGLVPFMMASADGSKSKRNAVRIIEILTIAIPIVFYGGKMVNTLEQVSNTQVAMQNEFKMIREQQYSLTLDFTKLKTMYETDKENLERLRNESQRRRNNK